MSVHERMQEAAARTQHGGSDAGEVLEACEAVAQEMLSDLLARYKQRGANESELERQAAELRNALEAESRRTALARRERYAAAALQGLLANANNDPYTDAIAAAYAISAVRCADALLLALGDA